MKYPLAGYQLVLNLFSGTGRVPEIDLKLPTLYQIFKKSELIVLTIIKNR